MSGDGANIPNNQLEKELRTLQKIFQNEIFLGHYQERRYVEILNVHRDVILIHPNEIELTYNLSRSKKRLTELLKDNIWIGITVPQMIASSSSYALWVKTHNLTFGLYWFKIKNIKLKDNKEILFQLKVMRKVSSEQESFEHYLDASNDNSMTKFVNEWINYNFKENFFKLLLNVTQLITLKNISESVCFLFALILALGMAIIKTLHYIGEYSLKLIRELSILIHSSTPIIIAFIDMLSKIIGGFYLLIAMIWNGSKSRIPSSSMTFHSPQLSLTPANYNTPSTSSISSNYSINSLLNDQYSRKQQNLKERNNGSRYSSSSGVEG